MADDKKHTIADLVAILLSKAQDTEIQYVVSTMDGQLVTVLASTQAGAMARMLKTFGGHDG